MPDSSLVTQYGSYFLRGRFRLMRNTFGSAGQDSFTDPPMQSTDMFELLENVVPPVQGDIDRRWGYGLQTQAYLTGLTTLTAPATLASYQNALTGSRSLVYSAGTHSIIATTEAGQVTNPSVMVPTTTVPTRMLNSRSYAYFANGVHSDFKKWDGGSLTNKWGIDINDIAGLVVGPNPPTSVLDLGVGGLSGSSVLPNTTFSLGSLWTETTISGEQIFTTGASLAVGATTGPLKLSGFGFTIPDSATISGILVTGRKVNTRPGGGGPEGSPEDLGVFLVKAGTQVGTDHSLPGITGYPLRSSSPPSFPPLVTYGGASDLWGTTWTPADIRDANFGVQFIVKNFDTFFAAGPSVRDVTITVYYTQPSGQTWTQGSVNNVLLQDGVVVGATTTTTPTSSLRTTGYGIVPTSSNIVGIQVDIKVSGTGSLPIQLNATLVKNNLAFGLTKTTPVVSSNLTFLTFGGPNDLWGGAWSGPDINSANFGVLWNANTLSGSGGVFIDYVQITVFSAIPPITLGAPVGGAITLSVGREYTLAFQNSITGHISSIAPFTVSTGPLTSQNQPLLAIPVSADPQVDQKILLATADGGDETTLYFVAQFPNSTLTYTDTTDETTLLLQNIYFDQDTSGNELGVVNNDTPPTGGVSPVLHRGRVYMIDPNKLYYSKAESDLVTASGTLCGKFEEAWPALNYFSISAGAEINRGLLSDGQVLYIGTDKRIVRLFGDGPDTFSEPESLFLHTGIANQDVWKIVFVEGNPLGAMWLTPDRRVLGSDFNTYQDVGLAVQNVLDTMNPAYLQTAWASYVGISNWNLYVLAVPTGTNTQPDTLLIFDLKGKKWYTWQPTDTMLGGIYNISLGGLPQFITVAASGQAYAWSPSLIQDRVGNNPVNFTVTMQTSWQDFTDAAARKFLNEIEVMTGDPGMLVTVEGASSKSQFDNPNVVLASAPLVLKPRGEYFVPLASSTTKDRFYRFTFVSSDTGTDLLRGYNIEGGVINRI